MEDVDELGTMLPEPETLYGSADDFVREFLVVMYRREVSPKADYRRDGHWWMHPDAVACELRRAGGRWSPQRHLGRGSSHVGGRTTLPRGGSINRSPIEF